MTNRVLQTALLSAAAGVLSAGVLVAADPPPKPGSGASTGRPATRQNDRERYSVLTEQNIFLKDRRSGRDRGNGTTRTSTPLSAMDVLRESPEAKFTLTGVVFEDGEFRACIEDMKAGKVLRLSVGDAIARGKITLIDIDTVAYEAEGKTSVINVGSTLAGMTPTALAASPGATPAPGAAPSAPLPDPNNPNLTIEERMRLRRAAELQKQ